MPIISLNNIRVQFTEGIVLDDISFSLEKGEYVGLIGPNGAGKSTLLKVILGSIPPNFGSITREKNISFGYVPQNYFLNSSFSLSVREVLQMASDSIFFWRKNNQEEKILEVLTMVGLQSSFLKKNFQTLSGGQKQRVIIARALMNTPDILLFDEPLSGVDFETKVQVYELLAKLNKEYSTTIIFVSHEIESIVSQCHRVLCLNKKMHEGCHPIDFAQGDQKKCSNEKNENGVIPIHHHHFLVEKV